MSTSARKNTISDVSSSFILYYIHSKNINKQVEKKRRIKLVRYVSHPDKKGNHVNSTRAILKKSNRRKSRNTQIRRTKLERMLFLIKDRKTWNKRVNRRIYRNLINSTRAILNKSNRRNKSIINNRNYYSYLISSTFFRFPRVFKNVFNHHTWCQCVVIQQPCLKASNLQWFTNKLHN